MRTRGRAALQLLPDRADRARRASVWVGISTVSVVLAAACVIHTSLSTPAVAQSAGMAGIGESDTVSLRATVEALDLNSRVVTLLGAQGNSLTLKVGDEVRNLAQVKVGDKVVVSYHRSVAYVLAPRGTKLPDDSLTVAAARAAPGQMPAGAVGSKLVVTATVVGMDPTTHTLQLVDPTGGLIRSVSVMTPEGQRSMKLIKVGDTISAIISEAVAIAVAPGT
jgi:hypothetical protein